MSSFTILLSSLVFWSILFVFTDQIHFLHLTKFNFQLWVKHCFFNRQQYINTISLSVNLFVLKLKIYSLITTWTPAYNRLPYKNNWFVWHLSTFY